MTTQKEGKGVLIGMRAGGNCVLCQHKKRCGRLSFCTAFGNGVEAIKQYFRCRYHTDPGEEENSFKMIKGGSWR